MNRITAKEMREISLKSRRTQDEILTANVEKVYTKIYEQAKKGLTDCMISYGDLDITVHEFCRNEDMKIREFFKEKGFSVTQEYEEDKHGDREYFLEFGWEEK